MTTVSTVHSVFQIATGEKELTAKDVGMGIILGITSKIGGRVIEPLAKQYIKSLKKFVARIGCNSFAAGTLITTDLGLVNIEDIVIGDNVFTYNEQTGLKEYKAVTHLISEEKLKETLLIELSDGREIESTAGHLIYIESEWIAAEDINVGQPLFTLGESVVVSRIVKSSDKVKVYNLTVEGNHNYFVGENGVLVHNESPCEKAAKELAKMVPKSYCVHGQCKQFARAFKKLLKESGAKGQHLEIQVGKGVRVYSDKNGQLGDPGLGHEAIRVGNMVFDNKWPNGVSYKKWFDDLGGSTYLDGSNGAKIIIKESF
jgi:hypothetical protein